jgi:hypothetical protein
MVPECRFAVGRSLAVAAGERKIRFPYVITLWIFACALTEAERKANRLRMGRQHAEA